jgi:hypothetical protein
MSKVSEPRLSGIVRQYLAEGGELMARLSEDDTKKRETAAFSLPNWLGRFQIEADKAIRSQKRKGMA